MSGEYKIGRLKGRFVVTWIDAEGKRRRHRLNATDARSAHSEAPGIVDILTRPKGSTVGELWQAYEREYEGRAILETMAHTQKALKRFWNMPGESITVADCKAHIKERRAAGIKDWTIYTELGHLRSVLLNAVNLKLINKAPHIARPEQPKPREDKYLTREQVRRLIDGTEFAHVRLAIILLYTTAARSSALCGLVWARCDFERERIDLRDPTISRPHKGRAIVPMLRTAKAALREVLPGALTDYVIEWGGKPIRSLKRGLKTAAKAAGIPKTVSPHILRHSAAVHMAEDGVNMEEIQQFLGHEDIETTRKIYARFGPDYLRNAAKALEFDDLGSMDQSALPKSDEKSLFLLDNLVGATGIEPVTPTMSRKTAGGKRRK
jgi:integrase